MQEEIKKPTLAPEWAKILDPLFAKSWYQDLRNVVANEYETKTVFPAPKDVFRPLKEIDYSNVRVVILGQDPYHGKGQATGMAFAVPKSMPRPPTLRNILKEVSMDCGKEVPSFESELSGWTAQGVLLLNSVLTVEESSPGSHARLGWQKITDAVIKALSDRKEPVAFMLWGIFSRSKSMLIDRKRHLILEAGHPSPHSIKFFHGCQHFTKANEFLRKIGRPQISWEIVDID